VSERESRSLLHSAKRGIPRTTGTGTYSMTGILELAVSTES
jgi:hypothetical protein